MIGPDPATGHTEVRGGPHLAAEAALAGPELLAPTAAARAQLTAADPDRLATMVEDPALPLADRLAAGGLLALVGDPRIGPVPALCAVPGGRVTIGLAAEQVASVVSTWQQVGVIADWIVKETPEHPVDLSDFWIARYPVTNGEFRDFLADTGWSHRPSTWYLGAYPYDRSNHPVAGVRAHDADAYVAWLRERTGHRWRLPTEAEWEYAAKGPRGSEYPWGDRFDPAAANTRETGVHTTTPVGAFPAGRSPFGVLDLAGNVEEYVADDYHPYGGGEVVRDDLVETLGRYRVTRGGSFARFGDLARTRRRHGAFPDPLYPAGFRLATDTPPAIEEHA
ncbi:formylglycine-generating enzyme family protein [Micromonospora endophytica]|uniref:Serine/threonine protein kinase n=1 Tax=Micromonospora endophytica TaxID=515350 RepID=A0A2W2DNQ5_9ACTN|nr:SUMF1/EgtB/PvdO family nonheme iron enzyme [Micromonospora endophytica]PZF94443.1 serine/threonine protein kinase [Micromonospora endophytica]RIW42646.1 serine/threonine protein kinase [Micromonospora endophytica]BCJ60710.1 hypothetical protein Jiend_41320 [Micromonospora endophytica]